MHLYGGSVWEISENVGLNLFLGSQLQPHSQNIKSCNSPNVNTPMHKNPFKWYRTKSITPTGVENSVPDGLSNPPSPFKNSRFLYDDGKYL